MDKDFPYKDIIDLPHHRSTSREHMSIYDRAAQFSPFAALSGYDDVIAETGRLTDDLIDLPEDIRDELNRKLIRISDIISDGYRPEIRIIYFVPDKTKTGGSYDEFTGEVKSVDTTFRKMIFYDNDKNISGKIFDIDMIISIDGDYFKEDI